MASSSRSRKSTSRNPHSSYHTYPGIENASIGVGKILDVTTPLYIYEMLKEAELSVMMIPDMFSSTFIREFYNHLEDPAFTDLNGGVRSEIQGVPVEITHDDLRTIFGLHSCDYVLDIVENYRKERNWAVLNQSLHGKESSSLIHDVHSLSNDAYVIQDILRNTVMLKTGDTRKITAQLSLVTYHILEGTKFDVADFILSIIRFTYRMKHPLRKKLNTLPLGSVIQYTLYKKYEWISQLNYYIDDMIPDIHKIDRPRSSSSSAPSSSRRPPLQRGGSLRESIEDLRESIDVIRDEQRSFREETRKSLSGFRKFIKFVTRSLKLKPTANEEKEWGSPVVDPPRHSIRRARRPREPTPTSSDDILDFAEENRDE